MPPTRKEGLKLSQTCSAQKAFIFQSMCEVRCGFAYSIPIRLGTKNGFKIRRYLGFPVRFSISDHEGAVFRVEHKPVAWV